MLVGNLAITLNLLSIAVLAFVISIGLTLAIFPLISSRIKHFHFRSCKAILWLLVTAPWWIALSCIAFFWPKQQDIFPTVWLNDFAHWHHVDIFNFSSWHAVTLLSAAAYVLWSMIRTIYFRKKQLSAMKDLMAISDASLECEQGKPSYNLLPISQPTAFTTGLLSPKIYVSSALKEQVSEQELGIIVCHERAHVHARDPMFKLLFATFAFFLPNGLARKLVTQFTLLTEQIADSVVTKKYDNLDVAQTLINVARLQRSAISIKKNTCEESLQASYFGNDQISMRVQHLINPTAKNSRFALFCAIALFALAPLFTVSTVDSLHHFIETFFIH